jgi:hypothetical protein
MNGIAGWFLDRRQSFGGFSFGKKFVGKRNIFRQEPDSRWRATAFRVARAAIAVRV